MLLILTSNHFDPIWRRPWQKAFSHAGKRYVSYADIQEWYMLDNLELARQNRDYAFELESSMMAREFIRRHPERAPELRHLVEEGRFMVTGAGDNIIDSNLVLGESIIRNFVTGLLWAEEELGCRPKLGVRTDAFGNSAQVPQIMRGCGLSWVTGFAYSPTLTPYWRGIDGSVVCNVTLPSVKRWIDPFYKQRPCPHCNGAGCGECSGRGIDARLAAQPVAAVEWESLQQEGHGLYFNNPEEYLPNPGILDEAERWEQEAAERGVPADDAGRRVRFGISDDQYPYIEQFIQRLSDLGEDELHPGVELNPNNAGTWVTRIKTKQVCRRQEYALLAAEAALALTPADEESARNRALLVREAWQKLLFTMFHDSVTGTMVDPAYQELEERWVEIDQSISGVVDSILGRRDKSASVLDPAGDDAGPLFVTGRPGFASAERISVWNPTGSSGSELVWVQLQGAAPGVEVEDETGAPVASLFKPESRMLSFVAQDVPAWGKRQYRVSSGGAVASAGEDATGQDGGEETVAGVARGRQVIQNSFYRVEADGHGITEIADLRLGKVVAEAQEYRPGELVLEQDVGSPWATLLPDRPRVGCAAHTRFAGIEETAVYKRLVFEIDIAQLPHAAMQVHLSGRYTCTLYSGIPRVDWDYEIEWSAYNARVRVALPLPFAGSSVYGVPYAALERPEYEPVYKWDGANGDWPACDWAGVESADLSVALLSRGTPSYLCQRSPDAGTSCVFVSLLRSPTVPTYLHDPQYYEMTQFHDMRDAGRHRFSLSVSSRALKLVDWAGAAATGYNSGFWTGDICDSLGPAPTLHSEVASLKAIKAAEDGSGDLVLRIAEEQGRGGPARLQLPPGSGQVSRTDLLERFPLPLIEESGSVGFDLGPWEIVTLRISR